MTSPRGYSLQKELTVKGYQVTLSATDDEFIDDEYRWIRTNIESTYWLMIFFRFVSQPDKVTKSFVKSEISIPDNTAPGQNIAFKCVPAKGNIALNFEGHVTYLQLDEFVPVAKASNGEAIEAKVTLRLGPQS